MYNKIYMELCAIHFHYKMSTFNFFTKQKENINISCTITRMENIVIDLNYLDLLIWNPNEIPEFFILVLYIHHICLIIVYIFFVASFYDVLLAYRFNSNFQSQYTISFKMDKVILSKSEAIIIHPGIMLMSRKIMEQLENRKLPRIYLNFKYN
ncbi:hypothetical protein KUTeg_010873 [Tegillarca granosa]|uniref:Uncharacterized protein n=1 Tax=Tegillarca granosa TaxID=220873 RepID=A0ABQ9F7C3_TEGGR|nr:hypothetical protein KUTeg_010873 [Tegillarca granosa]